MSSFVLISVLLYQIKYFIELDNSNTDSNFVIAHLVRCTLHTLFCAFGGICIKRVRQLYEAGFSDASGRGKLLSVSKWERTLTTTLLTARTTTTTKTRANF